MQGNLKKGKSGKEHLHIDNVNFELIPEKSTFKFVNPAHATQGEWHAVPSSLAFSRRGEMNKQSFFILPADLLSRVVSENDSVIMEDLRPAISEAFSQALLQIANRIFGKVAFEDAFPQ